MDKNLFDELSESSLEDKELAGLVDTFFSDEMLSKSVVDQDVLTHLDKIKNRVEILAAQEESTFVSLKKRLN